MEKMLTVREAARLLSIQERKARDLCKRYVRGKKGLRAIKVGSQWRIGESDFEQYLELARPTANSFDESTGNERGE